MRLFIGGKMKKFKYVVGGLDQNSSPEEQEEVLNKMGEYGFELVSSPVANGYIMFYFKREKTQSEIEEELYEDG